MKSFIVFVVALAAGSTAALAQADPAKKAAFIAVLERHDCRMNNISPREELVEDIFGSGLTREDLRPIVQDLMANGEAVRDGQDRSGEQVAPTRLEIRHRGS